VGVVWQYEVSAGVDEIDVDARFAPGSSDAIGVDDDARPFVQDVVYATGAQGKDWAAAPAGPSAWDVPCHAHGCRVRYRFAMGRAARTLDDPETAIASGDVVVAPPSTWLLHPQPTAGRFRFHVGVSPPARFTSATRPAPDEAPATFEASTDDLDDSSFAVFGSFHQATIRSGTSRIEVAIAPQSLPLSDEDVVAWVGRAVESISTYAGVHRFPVDRVLVIVLKGRAGSPTRGVTLGAGGPGVLLRAGEGVNAATTRDDWVLTHELLHVVLPSLPHDQEWLAEGLPSYLEPIIRVRAKLLAPEKLWEDLVEGLPQGLPQAGDQGLARTHTWGRTYWGGALFCLLADVTIRERTANTRGLDDVVRAIVTTGADVETYWDIDRLIDVGDRATDTTVLRDLYASMALAPGTADLPALWARLGVKAGPPEHPVTFDDAAPLSAVRRAIGGR
jgi:predicted metalloprotease with PDZ domain